MKEIEVDIGQLKKKISSLRERLRNIDVSANTTSIDIFKTIATSEELSRELKEIFILLHTNIETNHLANRIESFKIDAELAEATNELIELQDKLIKNLRDKLESSSNTDKTWLITILTSYRVSISIVLVVVTLWIVYMFNPEIVTRILDIIPQLTRR